MSKHENKKNTSKSAVLSLFFEPSEKPIFITSRGKFDFPDKNIDLLLGQFWELFLQDPLFVLAYCSSVSRTQKGGSCERQKKLNP